MKKLRHKSAYKEFNNLYMNLFWIYNIKETWVF